MLLTAKSAGYACAGHKDVQKRTATCANSQLIHPRSAVARTAIVDVFAHKSFGRQSSLKAKSRQPQRTTTVCSAERNPLFNAGDLGGLMKTAMDPHTRVSNNGEKGPISDAVWGGLGAFVAFCILGLIDFHLAAPMGLPFMIGSFGTITILLFGAPTAPVLNKWNIVVGHLLAAILVLVLLKTVAGPIWLVRACAMGCLVASMMWTGSIHPPGGALVLACCDSAKLQGLGWYYLLYPGLTGVCILLAIAYITDVMKTNFVFTWPENDGSAEADMKVKPA